MVGFTYTPTNDVKEICRKFANASDVSLYTKRARITEEKARNDVYQGKLAEFAVYEAAKDQGCTKPDFDIYEDGKKRFAPDLKLKDGTRVHVKCQSETQGKKYGVSWIFEDRDNSVHKNHKGVAALCVLNENDTVVVHAVIPVKDLHERNLFKPTKLGFKGKKAVYAEDLVNATDL